MDKILEVKDLVISFRTYNGNVKAVRDISFDLEKGETLAIVGESGSGKSVTARAIMGIEAGNAINEGGEIFYDGKDLLKISEEEFHQLRGNRVAMIFQDPLSSLNPIMKIGRQLTEAMILNGKANQKDAEKEYKTRTALLEKTMTEAITAQGKPNAAAYVKDQMNTLRSFTKISNSHERKNDDALAAAQTAADETEGLLIAILDGKPKVISRKVTELADQIKASVHDFVTTKDSPVLALREKLLAVNKAYVKTGETTELTATLKEIKEAMVPILEKPSPDWFSIGYKLYKDAGTKLRPNEVEAMNAQFRQYLDDNFLNEFTGNVEAAISYSHAAAVENQKKAVEILKESEKVFSSQYSVGEARKQMKLAGDAVEAAIDKLSISKDSLAYTFRNAISIAIDRYEEGIKLEKTGNPISNTKKIAKQNLDMELLKSNILTDCVRVRENFENRLEKAEDLDFRKLAVEMIEHLRKTAGKMVYKVTQGMAYSRAISLMEEVGIPEARKRIKQYPFQFSGGMRQRIVIAIALAANPDILICDEPTTALDVTIQAQILELINKLKKERNLSIIFITHDLGVVANMADKIAVMYAGKIVEYGTSEEVFYDPRHPYTWALLASMPDLESTDRLEAIPGTPPNMIHPPAGDAFAVRNKYAMEIDFEEEPPKFPITDTHWAATWLLHPDAPKVEPPRLVTERIARMALYGKEE